MSDADFDELVTDIKTNGLQQPIVCYQGKILDGIHRSKACHIAGCKPTFVEFKGTDKEAEAFVISANSRRRHLSPEQRRNIIAKLLNTDPSKSNRQIAQEAKADHKTVGAERERLQSTGEIPQLETTTGADGRTRRRKSGKLKGGSAKGRKEMISYREVVDGRTAAKAYSVLEEHLLDALQDLNDFSSFDHADEYAQATIEKLQEKLNGMQPHEAAAA
jgi:ParB-like chromosome segregation protein Spo0J